MNLIRFFLLFLVLTAGLACSDNESSQPSLDLRNRITTFELKNGLKVILLKRQGAPVFSAQVKLKVGNIEEETGSRGLAHFFEHMAFKGTDKIGTKDYAQEKILLDKIFKIGTELVEKRRVGADQKTLDALLVERKELEAQHKLLTENNEFMRILQKNGAVGLNATTSNDFTTYYVSLPLNKLELWAYMESERFVNPVMREFFTEVDVVAEERRMRIDNSPLGRLFEAYMQLAYDKSPYKTMVIGPAADIQNYNPEVARAFYDKFYIPRRMVVVVVGNIDVAETKKVITQYFSRIPDKQDPELAFKGENFDPKTFPRSETITGPEKPRFYFGYHRPGHPHKVDIVMDVIRRILCDGRTSRLYKKLVIEDKIAAGVGCYAAIPAGRLDSLFTFTGSPLDGHTNKELEAAIKKEIQHLAKEGPTPYELQKVVNKIDAELVYSLQSNSGLASKLAFYEGLTGSWEYIYEFQDRIHAMTAAEVQTAIRDYFKPEGEVAVYFEQK